MQSGLLADILGPAPVSGPRGQGLFDILVKKFGLEDKDDQGKVDGLRVIPWQDLVKVIADLGYVSDGKLLIPDIDPLPFFFLWYGNLCTVFLTLG